MRKNSQDAVREFRPYFDNAPVYGHGPSLEDFMDADPADRRQPAAGHRPDAELPRVLRATTSGSCTSSIMPCSLKTVLEQLDLLGSEVVPVLRKEFGALRPAGVPDPPTHQSLVSARAQGGTPLSRGSWWPDARAQDRGGHGGAEHPFDQQAAGRRSQQPPPAALAAGGMTAELEVVELRELAHPLMDNLLTGFPAPALKQAIDSVTAADGLIAVTPIFNASYSALFKAFFDVIDSEALAGLPVLIAAAGGTERHSLALEHAMRPLFAYLHAHVVPTAVYAAAADYGAAGGGAAGLATRIERAAVNSPPW